MASDNTDKKRRLGKGLSALMNHPVAISATPRDTEVSPIAPKRANAVEATKDQADAVPRGTDFVDTDGTRLSELTPESITPNPFQPRQSFDDLALDRLADSIKTQGLMQPIVVRPKADGGYELIAGERRWRAAQIAELSVIPAIIQEVNDQTAAEWALIENLQREDLNPIDRAEAFHRLHEQFELSHDQIAEQVGLERSSVSNLIRLLKLSGPCRQLVRDGLLSMGQARAVASLDDHDSQLSVAQTAIRKNQSVRQVEATVRSIRAGETSDVKSKGSGTRSSAHVESLQKQMSEQLGTKVGLKLGRKKNTGTISIAFFDGEQFDALCERLKLKFD